MDLVATFFISVGASLAANFIYAAIRKWLDGRK